MSTRQANSNLFSSISFKVFKNLRIDPLKPVFSLIPPTEGYKFHVHFVDDYSRFTWIFPLKTKAETKSAFISFCKLVERQFDAKIKYLQTD